jgi:hypothetical protein
VRRLDAAFKDIALAMLLDDNILFRGGIAEAMSLKAASSRRTPNLSIALYI